MAGMQYKESILKQPVVVPEFCSSGDAVFGEFGKQHICPVLRAPVVASTSVFENDYIKQVVKILYRDRMVAVTLVHETRSLRLILESDLRKLQKSFVNLSTQPFSRSPYPFTACRHLTKGYGIGRCRCPDTTALIRRYAFVCSACSKPGGSC